MTRLVSEGVISLHQMAQRMHVGPALLLKPPSPGPQSLTLIDPDHEWTVDPDKFYSKGRNCPFAGWRLKGKAVATIVYGQLVMRDGEILVDRLVA